MQQAALHPAMQPQDAVKLCFQAAFGAEHLLGNAEEAFRWLKAEWDAVLPSGIQLWEPISEHLARVNLAAWKQAGHALEDLFRLFLGCANAVPSPEANAFFQDCLNAVDEASRAGSLPFSSDDWQAYWADYLAAGGGAVHHSPVYHQMEQPHYRLARLPDLLKHLKQSGFPAAY